METAMKYICALCFLALLAIADGDGACGNSTPDMEAMKLGDCEGPARDEHAQLLKFCCIKVQEVVKNPECMCAIIFSKTAKDAGVKPELAIAIPKGCNLLKRPIGYKCGPYTLP